MEVADVLPGRGPHGADRVDVHRAIAGMGREDALAVHGARAAQDVQERAAVDLPGAGPRRRRRAAGRLDERRQEIDPAHHCVRARARLHHSGPRDDQRHTNARVVEVPLAERPLCAVIARHQEERALAEMRARGVVDRAQVVVGLGHRVVIAGAERSRDRRVDERWAECRPSLGRGRQAVSGHGRCGHWVPTSRSSGFARFASRAARKAAARLHSSVIHEAIELCPLEAVVACRRARSGRPCRTPPPRSRALRNTRAASGSLRGRWRGCPRRRCVPASCP